MKKYLIKFPEPISELTREETFVGSPWDKPDRYIIGIAYDKNPWDKREVAMSKGQKCDIPEGEPSEFCNFICEDDSDFITVRIGTKTFPKYKKFLFEDITESDILFISGKMVSGIRMLFANNIISLNQLKHKLETKLPLNEIERQMTKRFMNDLVQI